MLFPDLECLVHLESTHQFAASVFSKPIIFRIHGNLTAVACSNLFLFAIHLEIIVEYKVTIHKSSL